MRSEHMRANADVPGRARGADEAAQDIRAFDAATCLLIMRSRDA